MLNCNLKKIVFRWILYMVWLEFWMYGYCLLEVHVCGFIYFFKYTCMVLFIWTTRVGFYLFEVHVYGYCLFGAHVYGFVYLKYTYMVLFIWRTRVWFCLFEAHVYGFYCHVVRRSSWNMLWNMFELSPPGYCCWS